MKEWSMDSPEHGSASPKQRLTLGFVVSFMALCAKHASRVSKKLKPKPKDQFGLRSDSPRFFASPKSPLKLLKPKPKDQFGLRSDSPRFFASPKSPRPKQLLETLSNKAIKFVHRKRHGEGNGRGAGAEEEIGDGGVWQRAILMGDKCQPLDYSGVIYYDSKGNQVEELPFRSPRASPMPAYLSSKNGLIR
ncbi:hypothetical protein like AT1G49000 [Hibiscus trionum]|uniref:Uncharacterized protein n=1 Tax=Hibiscus trionum TaxID=183268 RepID=A0A9W7JBP5_HIBTR|nr:hypothetical protein like AT1G49000 [Hibiscus trionum]